MAGTLTRKGFSPFTRLFSLASIIRDSTSVKTNGRSSWLYQNIFTHEKWHQVFRVYITTPLNGNATVKVLIRDSLLITEINLFKCARHEERKINFPSCISFISMQPTQRQSESEAPSCDSAVSLDWSFNDATMIQWIDDGGINYPSERKTQIPSKAFSVKLINHLSSLEVFVITVISPWDYHMLNDKEEKLIVIRSLQFHLHCYPTFDAFIFCRRD